MLTGPSQPAQSKQRLSSENLCSTSLTYIWKHHLSAQSQSILFTHRALKKHMFDITSAFVSCWKVWSKKKKKKNHMETLSSCISFTHSWACFAEYVTKISSDVNDGCPSAGRTYEPPFRGLCFNVHLEWTSFIDWLFNRSHCDTGYI